MRLYEEYLARHSLNVLVPPHVSNGTIFLRHESPSVVHWKIIQIAYQPNSTHPGKYVIQTQIPIRNSVAAGLRSIMNVSTAEEVEWDEYEDYFLELSKNLDGYKVAKDIKEITLFAWEMFVYILDELLVKYAENASLFKSLNTTLSDTERYLAYSDFLAWITQRSSLILEAWKKMLAHIRNNCYWFSNILDVQLVH